MKHFTKLKLLTLIVATCFVPNAQALATEGAKAAVVANSYSSKITWVTDKPATSQIEYGEREELDSLTDEDTDLVVYHEVNLYDLKPGTEYNYRIISRDTYGNQAMSGEMSFRTRETPPVNEPPQISDIEAAVIIAAGPAETTDAKPAKVAKAQKASSVAENKEEAKQMIKKEEPVKKVLMKKGGILLRKGKWQIEPSTTYVHTSANKIVISGYTVLPLVIGEVSTEDIKRDIVIQSISARYGINNLTQVDVSVPFRYQHERKVVTSPSSETITKDSGLGDISFGVSRQIGFEKGWRPDIVAGLSVKTPTGQEPYGHDIGLGTGHWGIKSSLLAVKSSDPAILFGSLYYTYNFMRNDIEGYGTIKPGNSLGYSLGFAFGLNYQVALSLSLQQSITNKTRLNHNTVADSFSNVASVQYGLTWSMSKNFSCQVAVAQGLTSDSPDFIVQVSFPISF